MWLEPYCYLIKWKVTILKKFFVWIFSALKFFIFLDYQEKYQELLEREDFFPDYEENGTDLSGAGDPYVLFSYFHCEICDHSL